MNLAEVQQALHARLTAQVGAQVTGVYTRAPDPQDAAKSSGYPYITLGPLVAGPNDTKTNTGGTVAAQVHIWARTRSALSWRRLHDETYEALHRYDLPVTGANVIDCLFENSNDLPDPDGKTTHVVMQFRVTYELT